ncbi:MAG: tRNA pseudouridine(55) synthase TruB [Clostridia bacterium]|nr:tRNA pseudouridine(55) synthase TruB [Clostridia bacterium]
MNGFLNILKPPGMSSAAVVAVVKHLTGEKRIGHAGTLDPEAAGVLPVMVGQATRLFDYLVDKEKTYVAECAFGQATDTQDAQGRITDEGETWPTLEQVRAAADALTGDIKQRPGIYSAVKQGGRPLYMLARKGREAEAPLRTVHIERIVLHGETENHGVLMTVDCGRGTYIRSLCEDIGRLCGCPAHMRFLLRTRSGAFTLDTAMTLEEVTTLRDDGTLAQRLLPMDWPLQHLPALQVPEGMTRMARSGAALPAQWIPGAMALTEGAPIRMITGDGFAGIAVRQEDQLRWRMVTAESQEPREKTSETKD